MEECKEHKSEGGGSTYMPSRNKKEIIEDSWFYAI